MTKYFATNINEAPWRYGKERQEGEARDESWRFLGSFEEGPWVSIIERPAGLVVKPHSHNQDELVFILEGGFTLGDGTWCGPGQLISIPANQLYGFTVGPDGVKWLMTRTGPAGAESDEDWIERYGMSFRDYVQLMRAQGRRPAAAMD